MSFFSLRSLSKLALVAAIAGSASACTFTARGHLRTPGIVVYTPPPPPPRRTVIEVRPGHVWIEGHHRWNGNAYVWEDGYYVRERPGQVWYPGRWERRGRGHVWVEGSWRVNGRGRVQVRDHRNGRR